MRTLDGKVVAITGAASGIGRALALDMARRGAHLAISDRDEVGLVETAELLGAALAATGRSLRTDKLDVTDRDAMREYAAAVREEHGQVNVVVNNAGVALHGEFDQMTYDDIAYVMDIDFWGVVHGCKEFLPHLIASGDGHLVNISSLYGLMGVPGQSAYNAAKFGVRGLTEALRIEMLAAGHPVQVTCVHPGGIKTAIARNARTTANHDQRQVARFFDERLATMTAERAAELIVEGVLADKPRVVVGRDAQVLDLVVRLVGPRYQRAVARLGRRLTP